MILVDESAVRLAAREFAEVSSALDAAAGSAERSVDRASAVWHGHASATYRSSATPRSLVLHAQATRLASLPGAIIAFAQAAEQARMLHLAADAAADERRLILRHAGDRVLGNASALLVRALHDAMPDPGWFIPQSFSASGQGSAPMSYQFGARIGGLIAKQVIKRLYQLPWQRKLAKQGWNDIRTGGGYGGWRGGITRVMGGIEMLGVAAAPRGGPVSVAGVAAIAAWGTWKVANRIYDRRAHDHRGTMAG